MLRGAGCVSARLGGGSRKRRAPFFGSFCSAAAGQGDRGRWARLGPIYALDTRSSAWFAYAAIPLACVSAAWAVLEYTECERGTEFLRRHGACSLESLEEGRYYTLVTSMVSSSGEAYAFAVAQLTSWLLFGGNVARAIGVPRMLALCVVGHVFAAAGGLALNRSKMLEVEEGGEGYKSRATIAIGSGVSLAFAALYLHPKSFIPFPRLPVPTLVFVPVQCLLALADVAGYSTTEALEVAAASALVPLAARVLFADAKALATQLPGEMVDRMKMCAWIPRVYERAEREEGVRLTERMKFVLDPADLLTPKRLESMRRTRRRGRRA